MKKFSTTLVLLSVFSSVCFAKSPQALGHPLVQDEIRPGTKIEIEEDQDEVFEAVQKGLIKPFSELFDTVDQELHGRLIKVELEEDDDDWIYELKLIHENNVIKVEYNAATLEMLEIEGRNLMDVIKK
jgi:uncharacterized membrane protein YkoI